MIRRKDLLLAGLNNSSISAIISAASIFRNTPKQRGYAIDFNYNQAKLICIGCSLFDVGLPFRRVDQILSKIITVGTIPSVGFLYIENKTDGMEVIYIFQQKKIFRKITRAAGVIINLQDIYKCIGHLDK